MTTTIIMSMVILVIAITMSMVGKGGGNFYVLAMVLAGIPMHNAATTSQLIMMVTALTSMLIFHKHKKVDWKLALVIDPPTNIMALVGGYFAGYLDGDTLKIIFAVVLVIVSVFMFIPVREKNLKKSGFGYWHRKFGDSEYTVNLWITIPLTAAIGFFSGAVGMSGGAFKIPLMVLLCGIPIEIAVGTSAAMVAATALMGFIGHSLHGDFSPEMAIPLTIAAVLGGIIGSRHAVKSKSLDLHRIFTATNILAAVTMILNILIRR